MLRYNLPDRRKTYRIYTRISLICETIDPKDNSVRKKTVMSDDINSQGLYFKTDELLVLNTEINITFQLPKSNNTIHATVRVVRVETVEGKDEFGIGTIFVKLAEKDREEIRRLVERMNINTLLELAI